MLLLTFYTKMLCVVGYRGDDDDSDMMMTVKALKIILIIAQKG